MTANRILKGARAGVSAMTEACQKIVKPHPRTAFRIVRGNVFGRTDYGTVQMRMTDSAEYGKISAMRKLSVDWVSAEVPA